MEACCSFKTIVGTCCGFDAKDRKRQTEIVPLLSCSKDVSNHLSTLSFSGSENEIDLILSRVAFLVVEQDAEFPKRFQAMVSPKEVGLKVIEVWASKSHLSYCAILACLFLLVQVGIFLK